MHLHLDAVGGVAGDMFAAALLDIWPELESRLIAALTAAGLDQLVSVQRLDHKDHALTGSRFLVKPLHHDAGHHEPHRQRDEHGNDHHQRHHHDHDHHHDHHPPGDDDHHHDHRAFRDIRALLQDSGLAAGVRERAIAMFQILAEAEGKVHGIAAEDVEFHEVGAWDSIADIVTAAWLIDTLDITSCSATALPMGRGRVRTAHGLLPVPAPATALLLEGFPLYQDDLDGERITPTGAAILRHLLPACEPFPASLRLKHSGTGCGTKTVKGISNILRALVFEPVAQNSFNQDQVAVCRFELDDQSPEDLAIGLDRLRALPAVLDVVQTAVFGKKGRMMMQIQVLAEVPALASVIEQCFIETSTLGIRWQIMQRTLLQRSSVTRELDGREIRIKQAQRPAQQITAKVESDDIRHADGGLYGREALRRRATESPSEENE
jgi:uncharacterized protein (TIGR00299 family) protein